MINFKQFFEKLENVETIAVLPGGFKPPTNGHFQALENLLQNADKGVVFIGKSPRDGIDQEMAYQIWSIYKPYLSKPVSIEKSPITPVKSTYDLAEEHTNVNIIVGAGAKDEDMTRYNSFIKNPDRYPHVVVTPISIQGGGISGTEVRNMIAAKDPSVVNYFVPQQIKETDRERIKSILGIA
jgi:hypothetical protein